MKKLIITLFTCFISQIILAQNNKMPPVITAAFSDSLKHQIARIIPTDVNAIKLLYTSSISTEGKLTRPLIQKQIGGGSINNNDFLIKLRQLLVDAPAWKPAFDNTLNKAIDDSVMFAIIISKGEIVIEKQDNIK
jgi:hypothetical protein